MGRSRAPYAVAACLAVLATATGCDDSGDEGLAPPDEGQLVLHFDATPDDGITNTGSGDLTVEVVTLNGGNVSAGPSPTTDAGGIETPEFGGTEDASTAIVMVTNAGAVDELDPGVEDFSFGADINVDPESEADVGPDNGNNVIQRGLFESTQYKIQLDHESLTCRVKGSAGDVIVTSTVEIEPERWYRLACDRSGDTVTLAVTDMEADEPRPVTDEQTAPTGSLTPLEPTLPLSIGGKLNADGGVVTDSTDQFNGRIDNVYLDIS